MSEKNYQRYGDKERGKRRLAFQVLSSLALPTTLLYLIWVYLHLNKQVLWLSLPFAFAETAGLFVFAAFTFISWHPRIHRPEGVPPRNQPPADVFIPVCGEPLELIENTVRAAMNIDYLHKQVYILDDKSDPQVEALAANLGCGYLGRRNGGHAKAGNLNNAFEKTSGDVILTLDADQVPHPDILKKLVGYFQVPEIGFVQTKQSFKVPKGDPFCNLDPLFYSVSQPGKDASNAAFSCGSGVVYRREALQSIGGFSSWNIIEDLHTSYRLHQKGWRSIYHNHALSVGEAPMSVWDVYKQRERWATDSLRMFFWDNPFTKKGLTFRQKVHYAHIGFVYLFAGFVMPIFYIIPIISLFLGVYVLNAAPLEYIIIRAPSYILTMLAYLVAIYPEHFIKESSTWFSYFPCFISATFRALLHPKKKPASSVTPKTSAGRSFLHELLGIAPQLFVILLAMIAIPYGLWKAEGPRDVILINSVWALWAIERNHWVWRFPTFREPKNVAYEIV